MKERTICLSVFYCNVSVCQLRDKPINLEEAHWQRHTVYLPGLSPVWIELPVSVPILSGLFASASSIQCCADLIVVIL